MAFETRDASNTKRSVLRETSLEMTPMIDVTFLLLIFFLCTIQFKILEGKIPAYLPKGVGMNPSPIENQLERLAIRVSRLDHSIQTHDGERSLPWRWDEDQIQVRVGPRECGGLEELHELVKHSKRESPELAATLDLAPGTLYIDAVKVLNECLRADLHEITFTGARAEI